MKNKEHTHRGIWITIIILLVLVIILTDTPLFQKGVDKSTNQENWEACRARIWEICGMTESVYVHNYILDLYGKINNTEVVYLTNFVSKTSTDCWKEFAGIVCDDNFDMNKIDTAQISVRIK